MKFFLGFFISIFFPFSAFAVSDMLFISSPVSSNHFLGKAPFDLMVVDSPTPMSSVQFRNNNSQTYTWSGLSTRPDNVAPGNWFGRKSFGFIYCNEALPVGWPEDFFDVACLSGVPDSSLISNLSSRGIEISVDGRAWVPLYYPSDLITYSGNVVYHQKFKESLSGSVASAGAMFYKPIIGAGLAVLNSILSWLISLTVISVVVYLSYRAFRFFKH